MILFFRRKIKDFLSQKVHGNMIFSVYLIKTLFLFLANMILPFCQNKKMILSKKRRLKDDISCIIEKPDIHSRKYVTSSDRRRKNSIDFLYFSRELYRHFYIFPSNQNKKKTKKAPENLIYRTEIWLYLKVYAWRHSTMKNFSTLHHSVLFTVQYMLVN